MCLTGLAATAYTNISCMYVCVCVGVCGNERTLSKIKFTAMLKLNILFYLLGRSCKLHAYLFHSSSGPQVCKEFIPAYPHPLRCLYVWKGLR